MENPHKKKNWNKKYLTSMKYQSFKRTHFDFISLNKKTYIIGYNDYITEEFAPNTDAINNITDLHEIEQIINNIYINKFMNLQVDPMLNDWSIFDSLINLRQNLTYSYKLAEDGISEKDLIDLECNLSEDDKTLILKWCHKYGMPFLGDKLSNVGKGYLGVPPFNYGFQNDLCTCIANNRCICRLSSFLIALNIIFKTFFYYIYSISEIDEIFNDLDQSILEIFDYTEYEIILKDTTSYNKNALKSYIKRAFSSISDKAIIKLDDLITHDKLPRFEGCAETIISLAMYQLAIITSSNKIRSSKQCYFSECKHFFIPTRASRRYCMNCSRQKKYKYEHNNEKKD